MINPADYNQYQAFIFDMDGTLVDSVDRHDRIWSQVLTDFKIPFTYERMLALGGVPSLQTVEILAYEAGLNIDCLAVAEAKEQLFAKMGFKGLQLTPLLQVAQHYAGIKPMAIGTGANGSEAKAVLNHFGILELFDSLVCADMVTNPKPAPDTFLICAANLQVAPEQCLVFEDADAGIAAAQAGGMAVVDVRQLWTPERLFSSL